MRLFRKRILVGIICFAMIISFASCGQSKVPQEDTSDSTASSSDPVSSTTGNEQESTTTAAAAATTIVMEGEETSATTQETDSGEPPASTIAAISDQTTANTTVTELRVGTILYSHGCIDQPWKYPGWEAISVNKNTGEQKVMNKIGDRAYIADENDQKAFFCSDSESFPSATQDMLYVYTVPCDVTVKIEMIVRVHSSKSDGVVTYCYLNDKSNYLIDTRVVTADDEVLDQTTYKKTGSELVKLKKGDILYCGYGANQTTDYDDGNFYVKMTFLSVKK